MQTRSTGVLHASAMAFRNASCPSLPIPTQSNATSTTAGCLSALSTIPRAESGSFTPVAGGTNPSQSGDPFGGVTSTLNVPTRRSTASQQVATNVKQNIRAEEQENSSEKTPRNS